jgi:C4-dicarboxylate-specific signal transduction histidine kinase
MLPENHDKPEFRSRFIRMASAEVVRIDRMIAQLENLAAPRRPKARIVRLHTVVRGAIELVTPMAVSEKTEIEVSLGAEDDRVFADAAASKQVLLNLCLNAIQIQYQAPGRRWVRVATRQVDSGVELVVSDGGPGIPPQVRSRLFRAFQSSRPGGLGLGLSISRDILASFGARIDCDPAGPAGEGAVFRVLFRRAKPVAGLPAPAEQSEPLTQRSPIDWRPAPPCVVSEE